MRVTAGTSDRKLEDGSRVEVVRVGRQKVRSDFRFFVIGPISALALFLPLSFSEGTFLWINECRKQRPVCHFQNGFGKLPVYRPFCRNRRDGRCAGLVSMDILLSVIVYLVLHKQVMTWGQYRRTVV